MALPLLTRAASIVLTTAAEYTSTPVTGLTGVSAVDVSAECAYASGGGTGKAYLQSSLDQGATWFDLWNFTFGAATKKQGRSLLIGAYGAAPILYQALPDDTALFPFVIGDRLRWNVLTSGAAYSGQTVFRSWIHCR